VGGMAGGDERVSWLPAARWWQGQAPEWDAVLVSDDGARCAVGEVKWREAPFDDDEIARVICGMLARPLPPQLPAEILRLVFVPAVDTDVARRHPNVRIVTAEEVLACLR